MPEALAPESVPAAPAAAVPAEPVAPQGQEAPAPIEPAAPQPARTFSQDDVDRMITKRLSKAQRAWERERQQLLDSAFGARQVELQRAPEGAPVGGDRPTPEKFADFQSYVQAEIAYGVRQALAGQAEAQSAAGQREQTVQRHRILAEGVQKQFAVGAEKYEDFDDVVSDPDLPITQAMAEVLAESEVGADLAYYLGKNPKEAARIARLSPVSAARELGKLEAKLPTLQQPVTPKAPAPITPPKGAAGGEKGPESMSDAEFAAWRKRQIAARRH